MRLVVSLALLALTTACEAGGKLESRPHRKPAAAERTPLSRQFEVTPSGDTISSGGDLADDHRILLLRAETPLRKTIVVSRSESGELIDIGHTGRGGGIDETTTYFFQVGDTVRAIQIQGPENHPHQLILAP